jgi:hypothetical protein
MARGHARITLESPTAKFLRLRRMSKVINSGDRDGGRQATSAGRDATPSDWEATPITRDVIAGGRDATPSRRRAIPIGCGGTVAVSRRCP